MQEASHGLETTKTMNFFITCAFAAAAVLLAALGAPAASIEVPKQYRGFWCASNKSASTFYRCREATGEDYEYIGRNRMKIDEESSCPIVAVRPTAKGHRLSWKCPPGAEFYDESLGRNVKVHVPEPGSVEVWLDGRGRLHERYEQ